MAVIATAGVRITAVVDELADRTRAGEALAGAVLLGATTSLSGSVLSVTAAWKGHADLALSNALGGIAVQTAFLAVADIAYRRANLEHAAASAANLMQGALLITLMAIILVGAFSPAVTVFGIHPATPALLAIYMYGLHLVQRVRDEPMWRPARTRETREDVPEEDNLRLSLTRLLLVFVGLAALLGDRAAEGGDGEQRVRVDRSLQRLRVRSGTSRLLAEGELRPDLELKLNSLRLGVIRDCLSASYDAKD